VANHVSLIGHLGQDPQIRVLPGGKEVVSLNLAVNRKQKGEDVTDWYSIDCWEQTALQAKTYMAKGMQICVQGRVRIDAWDDKDTGKPRSAPKVTANTLYTVRSSGFPDARPQAAAYAAADPASYQDQAAYASQEYAAPSAPTGGGGGGGAKSPKDELWSSVLEQPQLWWDNRLNKKNPKAPDFKQKDGGSEAEALWPLDVGHRSSCQTEAIAPPKLLLLQGACGYPG
jgi:single-strand DNA-binding protein